MATHLRSINGRDVVIAVPEGHVLDSLSARGLLAEIEVATVSLQDYRIVMDMRAVDASMAAYDYWQLSLELSAYSHVFTQKTALICTPEGMEPGRFFAQAALFHNVNCRPFTTLREALDWATATEPES